MERGLQQARTRQSRGKSRAGCTQCKAYHTKCDEEKPVCGRCRRSNHDCVYAFRPKTGHRRQPIAARAILPADAAEAPCSSPAVPPANSSPALGSAPSLPVVAGHALSESAPSPLRIRPSATSCKLDPSHVIYFDYFRTELVPQLRCETDAPADFWARTVLRASVADQSILDATVALGALVMAKLSSPQMAAVPLFKTGTNARFCLDAASFTHYYRALRLHAKTLATFRSQVQEQDVQGDHPSSSITTATKPLPRSLLITTMLATIFELQHGNTDAVDKLAASCVDALRHHIVGGSGGSGGSGSPSFSRVAAPLDDEGVVDAELYLIRRITMSSGSSPMMPSGRESILQVTRPLMLGPRPPPVGTGADEYSRQWWRFFTLSTFWYFAVAQRPRAWAEPAVFARLHGEQATLVARVAEWVQAAVVRRNGAADPLHRLMLSMFVLGARVLYICTACAFDATGAQWRRLRDTWLDIRYMALATLRSARMTHTDRRLNAEYMILGMLQVARECRDAQIRHEALDLCRVGLAYDASAYLETMVMGTAAVVAAEEDARRPDLHGDLVVPRESWFHWSASSWNPDHTELLVTMTSKLSLGSEHPEQKRTLVRRADWDARRNDG